MGSPAMLLQMECSSTSKWTWAYNNEGFLNDGICFIPAHVPGVKARPGANGLCKTVFRSVVPGPDAATPFRGPSGTVLLSAVVVATPVVAAIAYSYFRQTGTVTTYGVNLDSTTTTAASTTSTTVPFTTTTTAPPTVAVSGSSVTCDPATSQCTCTVTNAQVTKGTQFAWKCQGKTKLVEFNMIVTAVNATETDNTKVVTFGLDSTDDTEKYTFGMWLERVTDTIPCPDGILPAPTL